jgi:hypothetical protein
LRTGGSRGLEPRELARRESLSDFLFHLEESDVGDDFEIRGPPARPVTGRIGTGRAGVK